MAISEELQQLSNKSELNERLHEGEVIKVISLYMPWAFLCVVGEKQIETRSKPFYFKGTLGIHASQKFTREMQQLCLEEPFKSALARHGINDPVDLIPLLGKILGTTEKTECVPTSMISKQPGHIDPKELAFGNYTEGRFGWILENAIRFKEPIPAKGSQGIWHYTL